MNHDSGWGKTHAEQFVPFNDAGDQIGWSYLSYPEWVRRTKNLAAVPRASRYDTTYRPNGPFTDTLTWKSYSKGRSSVAFVFRRQSTGTHVTMFLSDFTEAIPFLVNGQLHGEFIYTKKGGNFGCRLLHPSGPTAPLEFFTSEIETVEEALRTELGDADAAADLTLRVIEALKHHEQA